MDTSYGGGQAPALPKLCGNGLGPILAQPTHLAGGDVVWTLAADQLWLDTHTIPRRPATYDRSHRVDHAGHLMPRSGGQRNKGMFTFVRVQVRAANPAPVNSNANLTWARFRVLRLADYCSSRGDNLYSFHDFPPPRREGAPVLGASAGWAQAEAAGDKRGVRTAL